MTRQHLAYLLVFSEYHIVQREQCGLSRAIGLLHDLHHALEAVLHTLEMVRRR